MHRAARAKPWARLGTLLLAGIASLLIATTAVADAPSPAVGEESPAPGLPPQEVDEDPGQLPDFQAIPDRWSIAPPPYDLNVKGSRWDPYNQNILKGDYPIHGNDIFFRLTGISRTSVEGRGAPTPSGASAQRPGSFSFFGHDDGLLLDQKFGLRLELFEGSTSFKPPHWQLVLLGVVDLNYVSVSEVGVVSPDVRDGTDRLTNDAALQEAALEYHLADVSTNYDFVSVKIGRQPFNSDFRGLIFNDVNQGGRLFGSANGNRYQWNVLYFYQAEKDTNSDLNTFNIRHQSVAVANVYIQDFFALGYQTEFSVHYNGDLGTEDDYTFDRQGFLVRPDPVGNAAPHNVQAVYLGWAGEGHIGELNISHAFYEAIGHDTQNPIAGRAVDINGQLAFLELSVDRDWMRYQGSVFFTSGDSDPRDGNATAFDSILDAPRVMGGEFSYWNRQSIRITDRGGVGLMQRFSIIPDLRSSKIQGQSNFVNPGILMFNLGSTAELTPTLRAVGNVNYIRFVETEPLEILLKQSGIRNDVGVDISLGLEYRPLLSNNVILKGFGAILQPVAGFNDIFQSQTLYQVGTEVVLVF